MKAKIHVTLKNGVHDPQGQAIAHALQSLGFDVVGDVRQGKYIEIDLVDSTEAAAKKKVAAMCRQLLANTVIENYIIEIEA